MVHQNELLETYTPLEFCTVGQEELAIEAAKCFYDPEYEGDIDQEYFYPRLVRAVGTLKRVYSV